ncbi:hypothetical protein [Burkholderia lata]|uniref:Uncharacterized protein n=1 Tax=Burkholderia lata (strain ATCC 17760 / DSM 23089 / LMG 22485 / NCIMB 9086 / R18194 / 383) TaxID=482957 RepID=A0A6P2GSX7_BURL3|nr:hypothetical protein [Burkholderia lata]VWB07512.1 hypothetical protein BLA6863_00172 [Burkholderia lata]
MERKDIWIEVPLPEVLRFWVDAYEDNKDGKIVQRDSFVDVTKNVALFRLVTEVKSK